MNPRNNIIWIFALLFVLTAIDVDAAITSGRLISVNGSTITLVYDDNTTSYADISIENPDVLLELCADTSAELLNNYVTWNYKVFDHDLSVSVMPARITSVNASNCTTVNVDLSRGKAYYPAVLSAALSTSSSMSGVTFYDMTPATGFLDGNYTFNLSDDGHSQINLTITQVLDDLLNPMNTDYDYIIVGLLEDGVLMESHITSINNTVSFAKYGNNYTFNINGILFLGDLAPPMLINLVPARDSSGASPSTDIDFDIEDNTGVNISSLIVRIDGNLTNVTDSLNLSNTTVTSNDNTTNLSYHFNYDPSSSFSYDQLVSVNVYVCDLNGHCLNDTYVFRIESQEEIGGGDITPPDPMGPSPPERILEPAPEKMMPINLSLYIYEVDVDGDIVAEDHDIIDTPVWDSNSSHSATISFRNDGTGILEDIRLVVSSPIAVIVTGIDPISIDSLGIGSSSHFNVDLEAGTLVTPFNIKFTVESEGASDSLSIPIEVMPFKVEPFEFIKMPWFLYPLISLPLLLIFLRLLALNERVRDLIGNIVSMFYAVCIADEEMLRRLITERKITDYRKIYVPHSTYIRYQAVKKVQPIVVSPKDMWAVSNIKKKYTLDDEMAHLLYFAGKRNNVKFLTHKKVHENIKKDFKHIKFVNPFEAIKKIKKEAVREIKKDVHIAEEKIGEFLHIRKSRHLQDYVQNAIGRGVPDNEIREKMLKSGWTEKEVDHYMKNAKRNN